jgi:hypothetical protein
MTMQPSDGMECPLCRGEGQLKRAEVLERLGVTDLARVAQLSAEESFRLLLAKQKQDETGIWSRYETELAKRTADIAQHHKDELHFLSSRTKELEAAAKTAEQQRAHETQHANRRVEDSLREVASLQQRNHELESEMSKVARIGKREEMDFAEEAKTWAGICLSEKLSRNGDFILAYRDPSGAVLEPRILVDNKNKDMVAESDIDKLVHDAKERSLPVAFLVTRDESQLRQVDRECRWGQKDGVWILRTTRQWLLRDLDVLKPLFEQMRIQGSDFLEKNSALADEIRRTFADLDRVEAELKKASKAIISASGLIRKYRGWLQELCDNPARKMPPTSERPAAAISK